MAKSRNITDVWFRTDRSLAEISEAVGLAKPSYDGESYWAWVIGRLGTHEIDITRTHTRSPLETDTRIFLPGGGRFSNRLLRNLVRRLQPIVQGEIKCGRWVYLRGNEFEHRTVEVFAIDRTADPPEADSARETPAE